MNIYRSRQAHWRLTFLGICALAVLLLGARGLAGQAVEEIPLTWSEERVGEATVKHLPETSVKGKEPTWVSAKAFNDKNDGERAWTLLPRRYRRYYDRGEEYRQAQMVEARAAGDAERLAAFQSCGEEPTEIYRSNHGRTNNALRPMARAAEAIYTGVVREVQSGFIHGRLGSLLRLEVADNLKSFAGERPSQLLMEYPFANLTLPDGRLLCLVPDRQPPVPAVGDRIMVFVLYEPVGDLNLLVGSRSEEIIFFDQQEGRLSLPKTLRNEPLLQGADQLDQVVEAVRRTLQAELLGGEVLQ